MHSMLHPTWLISEAPYGQLIWQTEMSTQREGVERRSGLIMAFVMPLANSKRRNGVKPQATVEQGYGLH